jgi:hypothetical protein
MRERLGTVDDLTLCIRQRGTRVMNGLARQIGGARGFVVFERQATCCGSRETRSAEKEREAPKGI